MGFDDISPPTVATDHRHPDDLRVHMQFFDSTLLQQQPFQSLVAVNQLCNNQALRLPTDLETWPRAVIFDFVYGAAVLGRWYEKGKLPAWEKDVQCVYFEDADYDGANDGFDTDDSRGGDDGHDGSEEEVTVRVTRQQARGGQPVQTKSARFAMDLVYSLWRRRPAPDVRNIKEWLDGVKASQSV